MSEVFCEGSFYGYLVQGDLRAAISYLKQFPGQARRYQRYASVFADGTGIRLDADGDLNEIFAIYQRYYREVFYLGMDSAQAEEAMMGRFMEYFSIDDPNMTLPDMEEAYIAKAFQSRGLSFQGGRTGGWYGPYIWKTTQIAVYAVDLPGGIQEYPVWFLDGFLSLSWLGYISFGEVTPGGWTDSDGIINCVKQSYDVESENFAVSLLKHEAQHAMDISRYGKLPSEVLEYRAKLVELIYSSERNLLRRFIYEASDSQPCNGHSRAASRITAEFRKRMKGQKLEELTIGEIRRTAAALFRESDADLRELYP